MNVLPDKWAIRREAERLFVQYNISNGALYPYGFGFLSKADQKPWMDKAELSLRVSLPKPSSEVSA